MIPGLLLLAIAPQGQAPTSFVEKVPESLASIRLIKVPDGKVTVNGKEYEIKNLSISEAEITWDAYDVYAFSKDLTEEQRAAGFDAKARPSRPYGNYDRGFGHAGYPAVGMAFNGAQQFCAWLSKRTGKKYRLPTEPEWEYAARAGTGIEPKDLAKVAWFKDNSEDSTHPVMKKQPNAWGLYDMLGNASEWCESLDDQMVTRGGAWMDPKEIVNFSKRVPYSLDWQERDAQLPKSKWWLSDGPFVGFRIVCEGS